MKTKVTTVAITVLLVGIAGTAAFLTAPGPAQANNEPSHSSCMPVTACGESAAPTPTFKPATTTTAAATKRIKAQATSKRSTTTTSEVPPRLTPEQEAKIPGMQVCTELSQTGCIMPEHIGMGEDKLSGTDSDS